MSFETLEALHVSLGLPAPDVPEWNTGALGLPVRYVTGYLRTKPLPGGERLNWIDVDPTNDLVVSDQHVTLASGRDYGDVSPVNGVVLGGGGHTVQAAVDVALLDGRPGKPTR